MIETDKFEAWDLTASPNERDSQLQGIGRTKGIKKQDTRRLVADKITGSDFRALAAQEQKKIAVTGVLPHPSKLALAEDEPTPNSLQSTPPHQATRSPSWYTRS
jgi:hypothetical protein